MVTDGEFALPFDFAMKIGTDCPEVLDAIPGGIRLDDHLFSGRYRRHFVPSIMKEFVQ